jgi:uncharacterized membrane protein
MYNFVFWFFYKYFEWRKGFQSPSTAATMVGFTITVHIAFLYSLFRYLLGYSIGTFDGAYSYGQRKLMLLPLALLLYYLIYHLYYKRKASSILEQYVDKEFSTARNILIVVSLLVIPLIGIIIFTKQAVN